MKYHVGALVLSVGLCACSSSESTSSSSSGGSSGTPDAGGAAPPVVASPTGALTFGFIGDGREGCGGKDAKKACSIGLPIMMGATATVRVSAGTRPLADADRPEFTWVPSRSTGGTAKLTDEPSLYCDPGTFGFTPVAKKADCKGTTFFEHFVRVEMPAPTTAVADDYGDGFVRVTLAGEVVDEVPLTFRRGEELKVPALPAKAKYTLSDIINLVPAFNRLGESAALYAEGGAVSCALDADSLSFANASALQTEYGRTPGGIEIVPQRVNVVVRFTCEPKAGLGFSGGAKGSVVISP